MNSDEFLLIPTCTSVLSLAGGAQTRISLSCEGFLEHFLGNLEHLEASRPSVEDPRP